MSTNETTSTQKSATLDDIDDFERTIKKLEMMSCILPRALHDGEALHRDTERGIAYFLEDIVKEMNEFSDTAYALVRERMGGQKKELPKSLTKLDTKPNQKTKVPA